MMAEDLSPFMHTVVQDYFRAECPSLSECYRRAVRVARSHGWFVVSKSEVGRTIKEMARDTEFRAYRKEGGGSYLGAFKARGLHLDACCLENGLHPALVRNATYGQSGGKRGREILDKAVAAAGRENVERAYVDRLTAHLSQIAKGGA